MLFANQQSLYLLLLYGKERHSDWKKAFELSEATVGGEVAAELTVN